MGSLFIASCLMPLRGKKYYFRYHNSVVIVLIYRDKQDLCVLHPIHPNYPCEIKK